MGGRLMRWQPDTCEEFPFGGCVIEYDGPNELAFFTRVVRTCKRHRGLVGEDVHTAVHGENIRKNTAMAIAARVAALDLSKTDEIGFEFSSEQVLTLVFAPGTAGHLPSIRRELDAQYGPGVILVRIRP